MDVGPVAVGALHVALQIPQVRQAGQRMEVAHGSSVTFRARHGGMRSIVSSCQNRVVSGDQQLVRLRMPLHVGGLDALDDRFSGIRPVRQRQ